MCFFLRKKNIVISVYALRSRRYLVPRIKSIALARLLFTESHSRHVTRRQCRRRRSRSVLGSNNARRAATDCYRLLPLASTSCLSSTPPLRRRWLNLRCTYSGENVAKISNELFIPAPCLACQLWARETPRRKLCCMLNGTRPSEQMATAQQTIGKWSCL